MSIEYLFHAHALDKMIDDGQWAQALVLQPELNHVDCVPANQSVSTLTTYGEKSTVVEFWSLRLSQSATPKTLKEDCGHATPTSTCC
jgi:hypothetical protein